MMRQRTINDILGGRSGGPCRAALRAVLSAASLPYAAAMRLRRWAYRAGAARSYHAGVPVISIGNITTGGTGKTPMAAWLSRRLIEVGRGPAVLLRGYKAAAGRSDEAELLRKSSGAAVVVNPDRLAGAQDAVAAGADTLVLDDGFQHRRLKRDLDIVLIDATNPWGFGRCLPAGLLREPLSALRDADAIVITRSDQAPPGRMPDIRRILSRKAPRASIHLAAHRPTGLLAGGQSLPPSDISGRRVLAFCGIGNPEAFMATLRGLGAVIAAEAVFADHAAYTPAVMAELRQKAAESGCEAAVTTSKDAVKLAGVDLGTPLWSMEVEMDVYEGRAELLATVAAACRGGFSGRRA